MTELNALIEVPEPVKLESGTEVLVQDLRLRQLLKLLRIITRKGLPLAQEMGLFRLSPDDDRDEFVTNLLAVLFMCIPDAEDETIEFLRSMVQPAGLVDRRSLSRQEQQDNQERWTQLYLEIDNPTLEDTATLIEKIVRREAGDIQALGKRVAGMLNFAKKTGQIPTDLPTSTSSAPNSSADSPGASISSPPSTDGLTTSSRTFASDGSVSYSPPSENGATTTTGTASNASSSRPEPSSNS